VLLSGATPFFAPKCVLVKVSDAGEHLGEGSLRVDVAELGGDHHGLPQARRELYLGRTSATGLGR
jgi:hypothetical protein